MKQKRLAAICSYLEPTDAIIDIGCDHAYVSIEMSQRGVKKILATDIHEKALEVAQKNIAAFNLQEKIQTKCSDGLKNIDPSSYNTLVIAGMGTQTIIDILSDTAKLPSIQKMIIQSNNELARLRKFINQIGFQLIAETCIFENNHYYTIMKWEKGPKKLTSLEISFGLYDPQKEEYYKFLQTKIASLLKTIPKTAWKRRWQLKKEQHQLKQYLKRLNKKDWSIA